MKIPDAIVPAPLRKPAKPGEGGNGKGQAPAGMSSFDYARRLTEFVLLGNVAYRAGRPIRWDAVEGKIRSCPEADPFLHQEYRAGWSL